jgi:hypothetical protein
MSRIVFDNGTYILQISQKSVDNLREICEIIRGGTLHKYFRGEAAQTSQDLSGADWRLEDCKPARIRC